MMQTNSKMLGLAGILLTISIAFGAFGAHLLKDVLSTARLETWETAVRYQSWNSIALLALVMISKYYRADLKLPALLIIIGTVIFSGSLYLLCLTDLGWLGMVTPLGGLSLMFGWGFFSWKMFQLKKN